MSLAENLLFRGAFENAPIGMSIWSLEPEAGEVVVNPALCELAGYDAEELSKPEAFGGLTHPDDRDPADHEFLQLMQGEIQSYSHERRWIHRSGRVLRVQTHVSVVRDPEGQPLYLLGQHVDVTARHSERLTQLETVGQLAGGIAHDFNNLLAVILNYAALLEAELQDPEQREMVAEVRAAGTRAAQLTRDLLAIGRRNPVKREPLALASLLERVAATARDRHPRLRLRVHGDDGAVVLGDREQLEQALAALLQNADESMPGGGEARVSVASADDGRVRIEVADDGAGMAPEVAARALEPFFSTKAAGEGVGLGLAAVHGIVRRAGGSVEIESEPGAGTRVALHLPAAQPAVPVDPPSAPGAAGGSATILLVEDEAALRRLMCQVLERGGFRVLEAEDPAAAERLLRGSADEPDLLVTDVVMPGASGLELAASLRRTRPRLPVVFMSGYADDVVARHGEIPPDDAFLSKPFRVEELLETVRAALVPA